MYHSWHAEAPNSHDQKTLLLSIESWLVNRYPHNGLLWSPQNWVGFHPLCTLNNQLFFSLHLGWFSPQAQSTATAAAQVAKVILTWKTRVKTERMDLHKSLGIMFNLYNLPGTQMTPCFDGKRPCFGGVVCKNRGQTGSRYDIRLSYKNWYRT